jgi:IS4 transposase
MGERQGHEHRHQCQINAAHGRHRDRGAHVHSTASADRGRRRQDRLIRARRAWSMRSGASRDNDIRQKIETALARRKEAFALGHLAWTADGYTVKFRQGIVDIVRTAVDDGVFKDDARLDTMLDRIRGDFRVFSCL